MLELSHIQSSQQELEEYYAQLGAQHVTSAWIDGGISIEPRSEAVPHLWRWRDLRPQAMRARCRSRTNQLGSSDEPLSPDPDGVASEKG
jgi:gentisate 1,2-dioxygenase